MTNVQETPQIDDTRLLYDVAALAAATGMSKQYTRNDIRDKHLAAGDLGGRKYLIEISEAQRYARWLASGRPAA
jgi:hypothetical protein